MAKQLSYADALRILGQNDSEVLDFAEKLADGGLGLVGVPDLFGLRGLLVSRGRQAIEGIQDKLRGQSRLSRTERIDAAHRILVLISFFEAVEAYLTRHEAPFTLEALRITDAEEFSYFDQAVQDLAGLPQPAGVRGEDDRDPFDTYTLLHLLCGTFVSLLVHHPEAAEHGMDSDHPLVEGLGEEVPGEAAGLLRENLRRLAAEVPEFGVWVHLAEHQHTRHVLGTGLGELHRLLAAAGSGRKADRRRQELAASYQAVLRQPVLRSDDVPPGLVLPSLEDAYVPPRGRVAAARTGDSPSAERWWEEQPLLDDLQSFMAAYLLHPEAPEYPTVVLGHPGAGKSKFTEMLAAQLPASDFLPIRVELRSVSPNSPIHVQIEEGLAAALHTRVSWRELAESADGALPVVILDGFDELLQATGVDRSDYLERVQEFQHQQSALGQPVVVIVTSRTVVVDRARFPEGSTVIRLEPFDEAQIGHMLKVWNRANSRALTAPGAEPLSTDVLLRYRELAEQPLLLLMLLVYDAGDDGLRRASRHLTHGELYERLLTMFARREVDKHHAGLGREDFDDAVEGELRRLEVAALAMFTRRRQSVTADELDRDLAVLMPEAALRPDDTGLHGRIAPAHQVLGRFFFVHEARARVAEGSASVFEFLHATFGEYLVARAVAAALDDLDGSRARSSRRRGRAPRVDDGELYALSSFASYAGREKVVDFLAELLERRFAEEPEARAGYARLLVELFQEAPFPAPNRSYSGYEPARLPLTRREANYTSNLLILLCLVSEDPVDARELFPDADEPDQALQGRTSLWRTLPGAEWFSILGALRVRHIDGWDEEGAVTVIGLEDGSPVNVGESMGFELRANLDRRADVTDPYEVSVPYESITARLLRSMAMRVNGTAARFLFGLLPYLRYVSDDLVTWYLDPVLDDREDEAGVWSEVHEVMRLRMAPVHETPGRRLAAYGRLLTGRVLGRLELLVLRQAAEDLALSADREFTERVALSVEEYLSDVAEVVVGPQLGSDAVAPVLESLGRHVERTVLHRVAALTGTTDASRSEASPDQAAATVPGPHEVSPDTGQFTSGG
ncbi:MULTISPECIES: NACHT domain-containing NTPase [unclassified Nocardiopsis]|uniref:NACHT domain-containing protein n=1 Tax=unclassified Nocardiopsis TaxID=2649073 RepID=UPI001F3A23FD|nr:MULTISPECIES: hypothetical protein [unclassified Nocardiopsis]